MRNDGRVMLQIRPEIMKKSAWDGDTVDLVAQDASGRETWRLPNAPFSTRTYLAVGGDVAQVDLDS